MKAYDDDVDDGEEINARERCTGAVLIIRRRRHRRGKVQRGFGGDELFWRGSE